MLDWTKSFIEEQFPVAKISKESYTERKAGRSQTLTGLGKWWGRKPLILVRAALFGALLPVSDDKQKDKEIFLKILTMDDDGIVKRFVEKHPSLAYTSDPNDSYEVKTYAHTEFVEDRNGNFVEKNCPCCRPEEIDGPCEKAWTEINAHLGTDAHSLQELTKQLGMKRFGHVPTVGDCFAGGGSNVFEPARMGCNVFGSDLNPLAGVLTWADLNILGASKEELDELNKFQEKVFDAVCKEIDDLGVERNENGHVAKYYLYCNETRCPECGYMVPLLPSLAVSKKEGIVVELEEREDKTFAMRLVKAKNLKDVDKKATVQKGSLVCPHCHKATSIIAIRGGDEGRNLRKWQKDEFMARPDDLYQERLYAVKYVNVNRKGKTIDGLRKKPGPVTDATFGDSYYSEPNEYDLRNEQRVLNYVNQHFKEWQENGYCPSSEIFEGYNTSQIIREKGWKFWHQLYNTRELLFLALFTKHAFLNAVSKKDYILSILIINRIADNNSKLSGWHATRDMNVNTFCNQALNTLYNFGVRSTYSLWTIARLDLLSVVKEGSSIITVESASQVVKECDIWITDPPYADAVNYEELSEFFLAWDEALIKKAFPDWYTDSKRALAIKGTGESFNKSMVDVYRNLAEHMPDDGMQIVMFTHQDTKVWAELSMILWSAGLQVTAAWCIATETESGGLKQGNYVKGTVLMVLRKRITNDEAFEDELYEQIKDEVQYQIDSMHELDDVANPDFTDGDYLLAAYVAALKVITSYASIEGLDVHYELEKARESSEASPVTKIINQARKEAYDYLVPEGISANTWSKFAPEERFYIKGLAMELNGVHTLSAFQELARGFAVADYTAILGSTKSNAVRLKLPKEYKMSQITDTGFGSTVVRNILAAIYISANKNNVQEGVSYLRSHYADNNEYWSLRNKIIAILDFLAKVQGNKNVDYWEDTAEYVVMLRDAVRNDSL